MAEDLGRQPPDLPRRLLGNRGRNQQPRLVLAVLVVVIVELVPGHDLADDGGPRLLISEDRALELPRVDRLLVSADSS